MNKERDYYKNHKKSIWFFSIVLLLALLIMPVITTRRMNRTTSYTDKEDVARYIMQYHELPKNYVTKYGMDYMVYHNKNTKGYLMGGDTHINTEKLKEFGVSKDATLKECDIPFGSYNILQNRGKDRLVYTCNTANVRVFYTDDHYKSFAELTAFQLQLTRNIFWIIFACYSVGLVAFYVGISASERKKSCQEQFSEENT